MSTKRKIRRSWGSISPSRHSTSPGCNGLTWDWGESYWLHRPPPVALKEALPVTIELTALALIVSLLVAFPVGILSAVKQDTKVDYAGRLFAIAGLSLPSFFVGTMLLIFLGVYLPSWVPKVRTISLFDDPLGNLKQFIFPALILGLALSASNMRMIRSSMLEVLREDYIRTARAKGLAERVVVYRHALKNAIVPVITILGNQLHALIGGAVVVEVIFNMRGVGRLTLDSILQRDYPVLQFNVLFIALVTVFINLSIDLIYGWLDPRIRYA
jgi:peptide/nickel transport system permease protein